MPDQNQSDPNNQSVSVPTVDPVDPVVPAPLIQDPTVVTSPVQQSTDTPPAFFPQEDTPPIPDFQAATTTSTPPTSVSTEPLVATEQPSGSAAPIDPFAPAISSPKKKFGGGKVIATILGLLVLIGGVGTGVYLTGQQQILAPKAATCPGGYDECRKTKGTQVCECDCNNNCTRPDSSSAPTATTTIVACSVRGATHCGVTPSGCGGFCILPVDKTCDDMLLQECNFHPVRGALIVGCSDPKAAQACACDPDDPTKSTPTNKNNKAAVCFDATGSCNAADGLCAVKNNFAPGSTDPNGTPCGTVNTYYCDKSVDLSGDKSCDTSTGGTKNRPSNFCGTIQTDTACQGFKTTTVPCTTPSSPPTITAQCQNIKAYSPTWIQLTAAQLSALTAGSHVNFCVTGVATSGNFDKAKFTINSVAQTETTTKRPGSQDFCQDYTIPAAVTTFNVTAQIHHVTLGYK